MRKLKEMLRLHFELGLSNRAIARNLSTSHTTVSELLGRFQALRLPWPLPADLGEAALEAQLYPGNTGKSRRRPEPDWLEVHRELRQDKHVTLQLLWLEYKSAQPHGYQYSQFCAHYHQWRRKLDVVMRQTHRAGEKMFLDFAGDPARVVDTHTGSHYGTVIIPARVGKPRDKAKVESGVLLAERWILATHSGWGWRRSVSASVLLCVLANL